MSRNTIRLVAKIIAIVLVVALVVTSFSFVFFWASGSGTVYGSVKKDEPDWDKEFNFFRSLLTDVKENYKDKVTYEELLNGAYKGIIEALNDPYSIYYVSTTESDSFVESVSGEFSGVGVSLEDVNGLCRVVTPLPGTPADKAGIMTGDIITKVDGIDISEMNLDDIVSRIKGKEGSRVTLTIDRKGKVLTFNLIRELIKTASVNYEMIDGDIGYIQITQFDNDSHTEFKKAKLSLIAQGAKSFIVDVRNNPGGYTSVASDIAEQLMPKGPITHFKHQGEIVQTVNASGTGDLNMPVVLLINGGSASASEILAGAWQDSGTAVLVGTTTYGKGVAQQMANLSNGAAIKLSMYYFLTPDKKQIDKTGIKPDYIIENYRGINIEELAEQYNGFAPMSEKEKPKSGDTGLNVYGAQQRLSLLGYDVEITGTMDNDTVAAVRDFQKNCGMYSYGVLDYSTMDALDNAAVRFVTGADTFKDLQLEKAIELLN